MRKFKNAPIRRKLTFIVAVTSFAVLLLTSGVFIAYEVVTVPQTLLKNTQTIAQITAANASPALNFYDDQEAAVEVLSRLGSEQSIILASLYNTNGELVAFYPTNLLVTSFPPEPEPIGHTFESRMLKVFVPVRTSEKFVGTLFLATDLDAVYQRLKFYGIIMLASMMALFLVALFVSRWFQKGITQPIQELAGTAQAIAVNRDYLVRAKKYSEDELGLFTDAFNHMLTQIHERDAALGQNEERLRLSLESSRTGTWDWNIEAETFKWDRYLYSLFGVEEDEFDGRLNTFLNYIHPDDRASVFRQLNRALEQKTEFISEFRVIWPDKSVHYLSSRGRAFYNEKDKPVRMLSVTMDITDNKEAAEAMSLLAAIVESSDDAIVGKNLFGKIVSWNAGATRMFGYTANEAIGRTSALIMPADRREEEVFALQRVQQGRTEHYETVRVRKDGETIHVSVTMSPIKNSVGRIIGVSASSRDITDRILAEEEIRKLNTELEERVMLRTSELASTNHELEAFTYSVSHDLRAPLRHIDAFAQMLAEDMKKNISEESQRYISRIRHGVQSMGKLVDDLLNLSRVGRRELARQKIALNFIVDEILTDIKPEYEGRAIEWKIGQLPIAECDQGLIKQAFTNLISNSIKYTRPRENAVIEINHKQLDGKTVVYVRDNGVGFNMKYIDKLFGVFQRLHRVEEFEGTGVGLATVQRIIRLHGGQIWAEAELDKGATFYFTLDDLHIPSQT